MSLTLSMSVVESVLFLVRLNFFFVRLGVSSLASIGAVLSFSGCVTASIWAVMVALRNGALLCVRLLVALLLYSLCSLSVA